jgi:hypothetical protein
MPQRKPLHCVLAQKGRHLCVAIEAGQVLPQAACSLGSQGSEAAVGCVGMRTPLRWPHLSSFQLGLLQTPPAAADRK